MTNITPTNQNTGGLVPITERPSYVQEVDSKVDDLSVGGGGGFPRISLNNNVISLVVDGDVVHTFGQEAQLCILGSMPNVGRVYYGQQYTPGATNLPSCWSNDGNEADANVPACPSPDKTCAHCPMNVAGSAANGQGKACQFVKAMAVLFPNDPNPGTVYRLLAKGGTIFGDDRPDQQLFNLKSLAKYMKTHNIPIGPTVFRVIIDTASPTPSKLLFQPIGYVPQDYYEQVIQPIDEELVDKVASLDFDAMIEAVQQSQQPQQATPAQPVAPVPQAQPMQAQQATPVQPAYAQQPVAPQQAAPVQPAPVQPAYAQQPVAPQQAAPVQPAPVQPTPVQPQPVQATPVQPVAPQEQPAVQQAAAQPQPQPQAPVPPDSPTAHQPEQAEAAPAQQGEQQGSVAEQLAAALAQFKTAL